MEDWTESIEQRKELYTVTALWFMRINSVHHIIYIY